MLLGSLVIFSEQGTVERVYGHPGALFGCDWCPGLVNIIATGCQDRNVRVFDVSSPPGSEPLFILLGHLQRVFHVCWYVTRSFCLDIFFKYEYGQFVRALKMKLFKKQNRSFFATSGKLLLVCALDEPSKHVPAQRRCLSPESLNLVN